MKTSTMSEKLAEHKKNYRQNMTKKDNPTLLVLMSCLFQKNQNMIKCIGERQSKEGKRIKTKKNMPLTKTTIEQEEMFFSDTIFFVNDSKKFSSFGATKNGIPKILLKLPSLSTHHKKKSSISLITFHLLNI